MNCEIPPSNVRLLLRAISCCARISEDIYVEIRDEKFCSRFFSKFEVVDILACRIKTQLKSFLSAFKVYQPNSIQNNGIYNLSISVDPAYVYLTFTSPSGIKRKRGICYEVCTPFRSPFIKDTPGHIRMNPMALDSPALNEMKEAELQFLRESVRLNSHIEDGESTDKKSLKTAVSLRVSPPNFEIYQLPLPDSQEDDRDEEGLNADEDEGLGHVKRKRKRELGGGSGGGVGNNNSSDVFSLVFSVKEFRALLQFASTVGSPLDMYFEKPGHPLLVSVYVQDVVEADFVLATLSSDQG